MQPTRAQKIWMYERMRLSRRLEETIAKIYLECTTPAFNMAAGPFPGEMHLSDGQEPCAVGVCAHLTPTDVVTGPHRAHHIAVAKGVDLKRMVAEIFGKKPGLSGGRGGHMHIFDPEVNFACSGIIAQGLGPAVGAALSRKLQGREGVGVAFCGEGAANQGAFHESLNLAALWRLPVVFVIEDNAWGMSVPKTLATSVPRNDVRAAAYGMPGHYVPGNDPLAVFDIAGEAIARARRGEGPTLIEIETHRLAGHFMGDAEQYRGKDEVKTLRTKDPILALQAHLQQHENLTPAEDQAIIDRTANQVVEAIAFARAAPYPAPEEALDHVFA